jgi:hypothetical protein
MTDVFENAILRLTDKIGPGDSISPADAARVVADETGAQWDKLLREVRRAAVKLALDGHVVILLKNEMVDPERFRGIYRIGGAHYFTPRKEAAVHSARPEPLAPPRDYTPQPRPYTPPAPPPPVAAPPVPVSTPIPPLAPPPQRLVVRVTQPHAAAPAPQPQTLPPAAPPAEERQHLSFEPGEMAAAEPAEHAFAIEEATPVTRFEFYPHDEDPDAPDFFEEADTDADEGEPLSPLPPLAPALSFDDEDEYDDEDAGRAPRSATLNDIASELERYLTAELDNPPRGNAEIGDAIVRLPGEQDK